MANSTRYFQLTPDILLEYNYTGLSTLNRQEGDQSNIIDLNDTKSSIIKSKYNNSNNFIFEEDKYLQNFVLPTNMSESRYIQCINSHKDTVWNKLSNMYGANGEIINQGYINKKKITPDSQNCDVLIDKFKIHFTSRNYFGDYDGFIIRANIYDVSKNKLCLLSHIIRKTDTVELNDNPMLINQKLYTTYIDFKTISPNALINSKEASEKFLQSQILMVPNYGIMENTPYMFSLYGIKSTGIYSDFEIYNVEQINTIYVPIVDTFESVSVKINEATDGDYFEIYPVVGDGTTSFSDYINLISDGRPESYIILHELSLTEYYKDYSNVDRVDVTHREHYLVNAAQQLNEDGETIMDINEDALDKHMIYRPVVMHSGRIVNFVIEDQMKIINTFDNTTIVKVSSYSYSPENGKNPKKYGKQLNKIYVGEIPTQINVYNKRTDIDTDNINITNSGTNVKIENHQHSIIGFIESVNVGVSIEQIPIQSIN